MTTPRISIVTSSYNQGSFIERTIESIRTQDYPDVEHIVVDGMSSDSTMEVLAKYSHLKVIREPDAGQADAINKGFRLATGAIFGFVNSDDTLEPGALRAVAEAMSADPGRHVVMGRCRFIDERDVFLGVEHPSAFESHRRVLEIWKGYCLPQPAIFWTRDVWETCGPLGANEQLVLDYDLFCRFSRRYVFHRLDRILANYRLHTESKTQSMTDEERLNLSIAVSRRYWGSPLGWQYWRLAASHARFRFNRRGRASRLMREGRQHYRAKHRLTGLTKITIGGALAPEVAADVAVPALRPFFARVRGALRVGRQVRPHTQAWLGHNALHNDGWAGPEVMVPITVGPQHTALQLVGSVVQGRLRRPLELEAFLDGHSLGRKPVGKSDFSVAWDLASVPAGPHEVRIAASAFVVPHDYLGNQDYRPLSYRVVAIGPIGGE